MADRQGPAPGEDERRLLYLFGMGDLKVVGIPCRFGCSIRRVTDCIYWQRAKKVGPACYVNNPYRLSWRHCFTAICSGTRLLILDWRLSARWDDMPCLALISNVPCSEWIQQKQFWHKEPLRTISIFWLSALATEIGECLGVIDKVGSVGRDVGNI